MCPSRFNSFVAFCCESFVHFSIWFLFVHMHSVQMVSCIQASFVGVVTELFHLAALEFSSELASVTDWWPGLELSSASRGQLLHRHLASGQRSRV